VTPGQRDGPARADAEEQPSGNGVPVPHDEAPAGTAGQASGEPGSAASAQTAGLHYTESAAAAVRDAGATDSHLGADFIDVSVRRVIGAWVTAAEGDEAALAAVASPGAVQALLSGLEVRELLDLASIHVSRDGAGELGRGERPPAAG
jgi:hypothetical protein